MAPAISPTDQGNAHVVDYYLRKAWLACLTGVRRRRLNDPANYFDPEDWSRYDGELP